MHNLTITNRKSRAACSNSQSQLERHCTLGRAGRAGALDLRLRGKGCASNLRDTCVVATELNTVGTYDCRRCSAFALRSA